MLSLGQYLNKRPNPWQNLTRPQPTIKNPYVGMSAASGVVNRGNPGSQAARRPINNVATKPRNSQRPDNNAYMERALNATGGNYDLAFLEHDRTINKIDRNQQWSKYLLDTGIGNIKYGKKDPKTGIRSIQDIKLDNYSANPDGAFQQIQKNAALASAGQGMGFGGRVAALNAVQPRRELHKAVDNASFDLGLNKLKDLNEYNRSKFDIMRRGITESVKNKYFKLPTIKEINRYRGDTSL